MTQYQGFRTKKEAITFLKKQENRDKGITVWRKGDEWHTACCVFGGLDGTKYPWVVKWTI